jgi:hypothetical protein
VSDQTPKGQVGVCLIMNLQHSVQNVFAQTERCPHHSSIEKGGLLESMLTRTSLRAEDGHNYLCQKPMHRGKGTNSDLRVGLLLRLLNSGSLRFGCPRMVFLLIEFPLHQQSICLLLFRILIFCCTLFTHTC